MKINDAIEAYITVRDKKAALKKQQAQELEKYDTALKGLEAEILKYFGRVGIDSAKTPSGTAYKSTSKRVSMSDWDAFIAYVKETDSWELLTHAASKSAVEQYKATNDSVPPGVNWSEEVTINVRRGK